MSSGAKSRFTEAQIEKAVKRYSNGEPARALAKEYKVSPAGMYLWIKAAKQRAAERAREAAKSALSPVARLESQAIDTKFTLEALKRENELLKRKLLDLMIKTGEL